MVPGRMNDEEVTVFDSTGLAIQDVATATRVSQRALARDLGMRLPFL
ncbi:MAG TPA: hypothetical protein PKJ51_08835 [Methanothrix sp.]|nr:hypothetical protein [Methanothrix sp.]